MHMAILLLRLDSPVVFRLHFRPVSATLRRQRIMVLCSGRLLSCTISSMANAVPPIYESFLGLSPLAGIKPTLQI
jgi:hypothetical protein